MADTYTPDPFTNLYADHADIRREAAEHTADIRRDGAVNTSDVRREAAEHTNEIVKEGIKSESHILQQMGVDTNEIVREGLKESFNIRGDVKDSRYDIASRIGTTEQNLSQQVDAIDDTLTDKFFTVSRDTMDLRAQVTGLGYQVRDGHTALAKDVELNSLKGMLEGQKNTQFLSDKISMDGEKTRGLINELKYGDLNRALIERNAELVEAVGERRHWRHNAEQNQWAGQFSALQNQLQAFNSQLQETRQGMVNFGTMAGVGQTSTSNNVR